MPKRGKVAKKKLKEVYDFWRAYPDELKTASDALAAKFGLTKSQVGSLKATHARRLKQEEAKKREVGDSNEASQRNDTSETLKPTHPTNHIQRNATQNPGIPHDQRDVHVIDESVDQRSQRSDAAPSDGMNRGGTIPSAKDSTQATTPREPPGEVNALKQEVATLKSMMGDVLKERTGDAQAQDMAPAKIEIDEGSLVARTIHLTPKTLMLFDIAKADGYPGDLSTYINDVVTNLYAKRGLTLGLVQKREIM